jgi:hypothetical protein
MANNNSNDNSWQHPEMVDRKIYEFLKDVHCPEDGYTTLRLTKMIFPSMDVAIGIGVYKRMNYVKGRISTIRSRIRKKMRKDMIDDPLEQRSREKRTFLPHAIPPLLLYQY